VRRLRGDDGTTLVELLVVMVLLGVVGSIVAAWQISMQRTTAAVTSFVSDQGDLRTAMAYLTKDLRMANRPAPDVPAFLPVSTASDVRFFVNTGSGPLKLVRYAEEPTGTGTARLVREEVPAVGAAALGTWPTSGVSRVVLVKQVLTSEPLATYYRRPVTGSPTCSTPADPTCATPVPLSPQLSAPDEIGAVEVRLAARTRADSVGRSELSTRVSVVNAGLTAIAN
jgi:type II secretory pathway pseudopilin PulG